MAPAGRHVRERRPGCDAEQAAVGIERVEQRIEVVLVDSATVQEQQRSLGLAGGLAKPVYELVAQVLFAAVRGLTSGFTVASICSRRCS